MNSTREYHLQPASQSRRFKLLQLFFRAAASQTVALLASLPRDTGDGCVISGVEDPTADVTEERGYTLPYGDLCVPSPGCSTTEMIIGKGVVIARMLVRGEPKFVVGQKVNRPRSVNDFVEYAFVATNLAGVPQWVAKANLDVGIVSEATADTFTPRATNILRMSDEEWFTIFPNRRLPQMTDSIPKSNAPKIDAP